MLEIKKFPLEEFHLEYEHLPNLLNLATSDVQPWRMGEIATRCSSTTADLASLSLGYPNPHKLNEALRQAHRPQPGCSVLATSGAAEAIFLSLVALRSLHRSPFRIALPRPSFGAFAGIAALLGCTVDYYDYDPRDDWRVDSRRLIELASQVDVLVLNSPHNPTGQVIGETLMRALHERVSEAGGYLLVDEVFRLPDATRSAAALGARALAIGSLSKVYGLPGLRLGWVLGPDRVIEAVRTLQQYSSLGPNAAAVELGSAVLRDASSFARAELLETNRQILKTWAQTVEKQLRLVPCEAGPTAIVEAKGDVVEGELFARLLSNGVLLAPGQRCFELAGPKAWFRLGYGCSSETLYQALRRIEAVVSDLQYE